MPYKSLISFNTLPNLTTTATLELDPYLCPNSLNQIYLGKHEQIEIKLILNNKENKGNVESVGIWIPC